jgi:flavin-dependent dehydrogenase
MTAKVAIIGGGPSGAVCSLHLARAGIDVLLFERDPWREKPCGGGLTLRAMEALPFWRELQIVESKVHQLCLISPSRRRIDLELENPIRIVSRRHLDGALRRLAVSAGATLIEEIVRKPLPASKGGWRINGHHVDILVGAGGINDPLARYHGLSFTRERRGRAVGYFVRGVFPQRIVCRFFPGLWGYAWWFPRPDHASLGIELLGGEFKPERAWSLLEKFVRQDLHHHIVNEDKLDLKRARPYTWTEPIPDPKTLETRPVNGRDWLLVGDAAGMVDTVTGEGIPYALISGRLAAHAIQTGRLVEYTNAIKKEVLPELIQAARLSPVFYFLPLLRSSLFVLSKSQTMQAITKDMAMGHQNYRGFSRRLLGDIPRVVKDLGLYLAGRILKKGEFYAC